MPRSERLCRILRSRRLPALLGILAVIVLFSLDVWAPRGMTLAIGYAIVPVLAGSARHRRPVVVFAAICTILTWLAFLTEPPGAAWWMSACDRLMVSMVVWAAAALVLRRLTLIEVLADRTTALERASFELSRSNEELERFASVVSHDLRGPLNSIGLVTQLLAAQSEESASSESKELAAEIQAEIEHMSQLIQRLLTYGRVGGGATVRPPLPRGRSLEA
jgi:signal transduction histidine kinase